MYNLFKFRLTKGYAMNLNYLIIPLNYSKSLGLPNLIEEENFEEQAAAYLEVKHIYH